MPSSPTPNIGLVQNVVGGDAGTWGGATGITGNNTTLDLVLGGIATIGLNNSNVVLSAAQFQSGEIVFNSTLTGSVTITFPTSFIKGYSIQHVCTGSSAFTITLATTASGGQAICAPPGEIVDIINDGTNLKYRNLGRVGEYWDYAGSSVPAWVAGCTVPPYLNCDGTTFSSATYPALTVILGGHTLPDSRGRFRATLNQGQGRITSGISGLDGNTNYSGGGSQLLQDHAHGLTDNVHTHADYGGAAGVIFAAEKSGSDGGNVVGVATNSGGPKVLGAGIAIDMTTVPTGAPTAGAYTVQNSTWAGGSGNVPPAYIAGLTLIRAG